MSRTRLKVGQRIKYNLTRGTVRRIIAKGTIIECTMDNGCPVVGGRFTFKPVYKRVVR